MFMWPVNLHMPPTLLVKECPVDVVCKVLPRAEQGERSWRTKWRTSILRLLIWGTLKEIPGLIYIRVKPNCWMGDI